VAGDIVREELDARESLRERYTVEVEDLIFRAAAILTHARSVGAEEALDLLSQVRLGLDMTLLAGVGVDMVDRLTLLSRPASVQLVLGGVMAERERDTRRAELLRAELALLREA
jgi:protein arginine kinase